MLKNFLILSLLIFVVGCRGTLRHQAQVARLNPEGPSIVVLPVMDKRTDRAMDKSLKPGYLFHMQQAIVDELRSMDCFSDVRFATAETETEPDLILTPELFELEWQVPDYEEQKRNAMTMGAMFGALGGGIYLSGGTDVIGFCKLGVRVETTQKPKRTFNRTYTAAAAQQRARATSDTGKAKVTIASLAFQNALEKMKAELEPQARGYKKTSTQ